MKPSIANPASVNCMRIGGEAKFRTTRDGGQYSLCQFPSGFACEEWALMNHECKPESQLPPDLLLNVHQQNNAWGFRYHGVLLDPFSGEASYYEMTDRSRVGSLDWQKPTSTWDQIL